MFSSARAMSSFCSRNVSMLSPKHHVLGNWCVQDIPLHGPHQMLPIWLACSKMFMYLVDTLVHGMSLVSRPWVICSIVLGHSVVTWVHGTDISYMSYGCPLSNNLKPTRYVSVWSYELKWRSISANKQPTEWMNIKAKVNKADCYRFISRNAIQYK
jgi:hypothetical protein